MEEKKKKVVVAFSGGLDTSFTVMYLAKEKGYEVYAACANTGGFSEEQLKTNEENAYKLGAVKYVTLDVTQEYYEKSLKYMVFGNVLRNGTYPISVSSERIFQALAIARYANEIGADAIAHGSTGAGNDQIRFDMTFLVLAPNVEIITLTRDMALSRQEEIDYLNKHGFSADFTKLKYSYNVGLWGTSICGGEILDSAQGLPETAYLKHVEKEGSEQLRLTFEKGELKAVNDEKFDDPIKAIQKAEEKGLLGKNILNSGFDFDLKISQGAGAFVCGEGSALTASIEGNRGMPRVKPPRTVEKGLFEKPTVLNNVETYCNVPPIINKGAAWYKTIGPDKNHGTKAFALTGNVMNTGLIEVPMGTPLRKVIFDIGGGVKGGEFKAVQIGGPSGGCLCINPSEDHLNLQLDFDSLKKVGAMIGSGGLVVMNDKSCMVEVARFFMNFTQNESCGKCIPCREGTKRMLELLTDICEGRGTMQHITLLEELSETISATALCGLGKTAASPVVSTMKYFRDEYIAHVVDKKCPAGQCKALVTLQIDPELCKGCSKCSRVCPVGAISGEIKKPFKIDTTKCIKCGACKEGCPFHAVKEV